jgi:hypothetical protein
MTHPTCKTCRFWQQPRPHYDPECRIRAPVAQVMNRGDEGCEHAGISWWPETDADDWCGEHQPREAAAEKPKVREPGWYWVRCRNGPWFIAECSGAGWVYGTRTLEHEPLIVDERRIERGDA